MAALTLTQRLLGIVALCCMAVAAPLDPTQRTVALTALAVGVAAAAVLPRYDTLALRVAGPALVVLTVVPIHLPWAALHALALVAVGFVVFDHHGMNRLVPALGLPLMMLLFRTGEQASGRWLAAWAVAVVAGILVGAVDGYGDRLPRLASASSAPTTAGIARSALLNGTVAVTLALAAALAVPTALSVALGGGADGSGAGADAVHPGLTGGLDAGSPVELDPGVVLRVTADRPLYWRGTTYDVWDGRRWAASGLDDGSDEFDGAAGEIDAGTGELPAPVTVEQHFRFERPGLDVALAAWEPTVVEVDGATVPVSGDGLVPLEEPLGEGATWTALSAVRPITAEHLRAADPSQLPATHPINVRYASETVRTPAVARLAEDITAEATTTYDKVVAIEAWMDEHLRYTRDIEPLPAGADAVDHLLFASRAGYCEQIGSALVVMLRSLGIPARLVVGYVPHRFDPSTGEWLSRGVDAHAWAEVYFPGVGWQGFDPTAGVPLAGAPVDAVEPEEAPAAGLGRMTVIGALAVVLVTGGVGMVVRRWRRRLVSPSGPDGRGPVGPVDPLVARFEALADRLGLAWAPGRTLRERGRELEGEGADPVLVAAAVHGLERLLYFGPPDLEGDLDAGVGVEADDHGGPTAASLEREATAHLEALEAEVAAVAARPDPARGERPQEALASGCPSVGGGSSVADEAT
ncbi:MAG: transglutaminaseTgpA domain-containing protein [Actinomycetota bacterium]